MDFPPRRDRGRSGAGRSLEPEEDQDLEFELDPPRMRRPERETGRDSSLEASDEPEPAPTLREQDASRARRIARAQRAAPARSRSETAARVGIAIPWIVFAIVIVALGGLPFAVAMIGLGWVALVELFRMGKRFEPMLPVAIAAVGGMALAAYFGSQFQVVLVIALSFPAMFAFAMGRRAREGVTASMAMTAFGILWFGIPFSHAVLLRELPLHGGALLIDVLVGTFLTDTAAYAGGRLFGRRRLAPSISPNKTVEGLVAGLIGGTMGFWFAGLYQDWLSGLDGLIMGICIASIAPVGDLFESMVKRDLGVKDTGRAFGPHGGLLDRLDAVLFTIVIGYYLAVALVY
jgi:phosphatidate cytidylyltransferase